MARPCSACLPGDQRATTNVGGASAPTATPQPQPAPAPAAPTSPESLWDVAMADVDGSSNPEVSAAVAAGLQEFRAGAGYAEVRRLTWRLLIVVSGGARIVSEDAFLSYCAALPTTLPSPRPYAVAIWCLRRAFVCYCVGGF